MFGGGDEKGSAGLEIPIRIGAGFPAVGEKVSVKMVSGESVGASERELMADGLGGRRSLCDGYITTGSSGGLAGPGAEQRLQPSENAEGEAA